MELVALCQRLRPAFLDGYLSDAKTREVSLPVCGDLNNRPGSSEMRVTREHSRT